MWAQSLAVSAMAISETKRVSDMPITNRCVSLCLVMSPVKFDGDGDDHIATSVQLVHWDDQAGRVGRKIRPDGSGRLVYSDKRNNQHHFPEHQFGDTRPQDSDTCHVIIPDIITRMFRGAGMFRPDVPKFVLRMMSCLESTITPMYEQGSSYNCSCCVCNSWTPLDNGDRLAECPLCLRTEHGWMGHTLLVIRGI